MDEVGNLASRSFDFITILQGGYCIVATILTHYLLGLADVIGCNRVVTRPELNAVQHQDIGQRAKCTCDGNEDKASNGIDILVVCHVILPANILIP